MKHVFIIIISINLTVSACWARTNPFAPSRSERQQQQEQLQLSNATRLKNCINRLVRGGMLASTAQGICHDVLSSVEPPQETNPETIQIGMTLQRCVQSMRGRAGMGRAQAVQTCRNMLSARPNQETEQYTGDLNGSDSRL